MGYNNYLLAKAAEGAGGGVFPLGGTLAYEPLLSEGDKDIIVDLKKND